MMSLCFSRDDEEDDLDAKRVVFAPLKRAAATAATAAAAFNGGGTARVRIKDVMVVGVQNVLCSSRR
jgi:broad specificity phosphatase PhoE